MEEVELKLAEFEHNGKQYKMSFPKTIVDQIQAFHNIDATDQIVEMAKHELDANDKLPDFGMGLNQ